MLPVEKVGVPQPSGAGASDLQTHVITTLFPAARIFFRGE
jgi:hypothetical protein